MSNDWRSRLTADEADELELLDDARAKCRFYLKALASEKKAIVNRAIQRNRANQKIGVDMDAVTP